MKEVNFDEMKAMTGDPVKIVCYGVETWCICHGQVQDTDTIMLSHLSPFIVTRDFWRLTWRGYVYTKSVDRRVIL